ncbi:MAG: TetR/AcrR family transcriptional regulator [Chitinimonas sp.]|nr:TetR/AcrR family transcriptional regulator [Chitinimonas sp.]
MEVVSFKQKMQLAREDVILEAVNHLLASKGFELMTVDEVAAEAGIAKASLYRHFASKEELAAAAMVRMLDQALALADSLPEQVGPVEKLQALARWAMQTQLAGQMPALPHANSALVGALSRHQVYLERVFRLSDRMGEWIVQAQELGLLAADLPPQLILYNLFARACDPVLHFLKATGAHSDEEIIALLLRTTFTGLAR